MEVWAEYVKISKAKTIKIKRRKGQLLLLWRLGGGGSGDVSNGRWVCILQGELQEPTARPRGIGWIDRGSVRQGRAKPDKISGTGAASNVSPGKPHCLVMHSTVRNHSLIRWVIDGEVVRRFSWSSKLLTSSAYSGACWLVYHSWLWGTWWLTLGKCGGHSRKGERRQEDMACTAHLNYDFGYLYLCLELQYRSVLRFTSCYVPVLSNPRGAFKDRDETWEL